MFKSEKLGLIFRFEKRDEYHERFNENRLFTHCHCLQDDKVPLVTKHSVLNPVDKHDKVKGKKIALAKVLHALPITKSQRTEIWQEFFSWVESWKGNITNEDARTNTQ